MSGNNDNSPISQLNESKSGTSSRVDTMFQDLRYAARMLRKNPGLTIVVMLSLAIGIGANTAVFSVTNALLLKPLAYPEPDRLADLWLRSPGIGIPEDWPSPGHYNDVKTQSHVFEDIALCIGRNQNLTGLAQPERVGVVNTSANLLGMLGAKPFIGRSFLPDEDAPDKPATVVLTYGIWQRLFGADKQIINKSLVLDGKQFTVVGVLDPQFALSREVMPTVGGIDTAEIFTPLTMTEKLFSQRGNENFNIVARLKPGITFTQAQADIDVISSRIREADKRDPTFTISVVPLLEQVVGNVRRNVLILFGAVAFVLLIGCANVASLLLARAASRQKEIAVRAALGAGLSRIVRQLLTESVLLSLLGGVAGIAMASTSLYFVRVINPGNIPRLDEIGIDGRVLLFTFGLSIITGLLFGIAPALRASRVDLNSALKAGGRGSQDGGGLTKDMLRSCLVVAEIALSLMLLIGAGLLIRSFARLQNVSPGFNTDNAISMQVALTNTRFNTGPIVLQFYDDLAERVTHMPGVKSFGAVSVLPLTSAVGWGGVDVEGYVPPPNAPEVQVDQRIVSIGYFPAMEIPLIKGRNFTNQDVKASQEVVIVDEKMANHFWPNADAVGKRVRTGGSDAPWKTIVGVTGIVKQYGLGTDTRMVLYYPHKQAPSRGMYIVARTATDAANATGGIISEIHRLDPDAPVYNISTMDKRLHSSLARQRFTMSLLAAFAGFALLLASIGLYALLSYIVIQGTRDIGVRMALGAGQSDILKMIVKQGLVLTLIGLVVGLGGAFGLTRVMSGLLYGVSTTDMATFGGVATVLTLVAFAACYIPARRASKVDPMIALRYE